MTEWHQAVKRPLTGCGGTPPTRDSPLLKKEQLPSCFDGAPPLGVTTGASASSSNLTTLKACLVKLPGNVARDLKSLGEGAPLGNKARNGGAGCYVTAFRKLLNLQVDKPFSHSF